MKTYTLTQDQLDTLFRKQRESCAKVYQNCSFFNEVRAIVDAPAPAIDQEQINKKRNKGFFWVKYNERWCIAEYDGGASWYVGGILATLRESEFTEIGTEVYNHYYENK